MIPPCEFEELLEKGECVIPCEWFCQFVEEVMMFFKRSIRHDKPYSVERDGYKFWYVKIHLI